LNQIIAFDFKTNGELIIATSNGIYILEDEKWTELDISSGGQITTPFDNIADMQVDSRDQIWIVSNDGSIYIFDGEEWISSFPGDAGLDLSYIDHLEIDPNDRGWILPFSGGVYMYDPDEGWFNFSPDPIGIYIYYPNTIEIDQYGRIWIGSKSGVAVFSPPIP
jgi:ligand-binding sensor domain-containing protein